MAAILDFQMFISQLFEELQSWNSEFKLITPKPITGTYFDTKLSRFGLAGSAMVAILEFSMFISQQFEELQGWNLDFFIIDKLLIGSILEPYCLLLIFQKAISHLFEEL